MPIKPDVVGGFGCPLADRSRTAVLAESRDDEQTFGRDTSRTGDHIRCDGANTDVDASGSGVNEPRGHGDLVADDHGSAESDR